MICGSCAGGFSAIVERDLALADLPAEVIAVPPLDDGGIGAGVNGRGIRRTRPRPALLVAVACRIGETAPRQMKTGEDVRKFVAQQVASEEAALKKDREAKSNELWTRVRRFTRSRDEAEMTYPLWHMNPNVSPIRRRYCRTISSATTQTAVSAGFYFTCWFIATRRSTGTRKRVALGLRASNC